MFSWEAYSSIIRHTLFRNRLRHIDRHHFWVSATSFFLHSIKAFEWLWKNVQFHGTLGWNSLRNFQLQITLFLIFWDTVMYMMYIFNFSVITNSIMVVTYINWIIVCLFRISKRYNFYYIFLFKLYLTLTDGFFVCFYSSLILAMKFFFL